eukprot:15006234-Ditylum_brightwellii.AAC.1
MSRHNTGSRTNQAKGRTLARSQALAVLSQTPVAHMHTLYMRKAGVRHANCTSASVLGLTLSVTTKTLEVTKI